MSRASKSTRDSYRPCNKTKLLEKIRRLYPDLPPFKDALWIHQANCASSRYFVPCDCEVKLRCGEKLYEL